MKPYLDILKLVWPLALGMVNNAVMQFVDRAYLAQVSEDALGAVLPASVLAWIFMGFFQSVVGYSGVFVAQYHGAKDPAKCRGCYHAAVLIALVSGLLMLPLWPLGSAIISCTAPNAVIGGLERTYFDILILGGIFVFGQMAASSFFTGRGRTRVVYLVNLLGNLANVIADPFLIFGWCGLPALGVAGAAYVTVACTALQCVVMMLLAHREERGCVEFAAVLSLTGRILRYGVPSGLYEFLNMASFTVFVFVTEGVGALELAASNACFTINYLLFAPMTGFAIGVQTLVGQARGRGDDAAAASALRRTMILGLGFVALGCAATVALHRPILSLFAPAAVEASSAFHALGLELLLMMSAWMLFDAADVIYSGALKGAGDTKFVMLWMLLSSFGIWLPLVFAVRSFRNTMPALWGTMVVYVIIICVGSAIRWRRGGWRRIRLIESKSA